MADDVRTWAAAALECSPDDLAGAPAPAADRAASAALAGLPGPRQALVDIDLSEPGLTLGPPVAALATTVELVGTLMDACDYAGAARLLPGLLRDPHAETAGSSPSGSPRSTCTPLPRPSDRPRAGGTVPAPGRRRAARPQRTDAPDRLRRARRQAVSS